MNLFCGIGSITINGKYRTDDVYYVEGLRHSLLSVRCAIKVMKSYLVSPDVRLEKKNLEYWSQKVLEKVEIFMIQRMRVKTDYCWHRTVNVGYGTRGGDI